ncbi:MAG TPA: hypothetical protein VFW26_01115, partial [Gaiellales bacterium]|nr:hypothetical protein [Gaiellales bacterium]
SRTLGFPGNRLGAGEESRAPGRTGRDGEPMGRGPDGGLYVGATVLAIFAPNAAAGYYLVIALVTVARARGDSPSPEPEASRAA